MSGFEIVGLILGAFGVAGPLKSLGDSLNSATNSSRSFQEFLEDASSRAFIHEARYLELCKRLLRPIGLEEAELKAMFGQGGHDHEKWKDKVFVAMLDKFLDSDKAIIYISMKSVQREISRLQRRVMKLSKDIFIPINSDEYSSAIKLTMKDKFRLSKGKKEKIEKSLCAFKDRLEDFEKVVKDFLEKTMKDLTHQRRHVRQELDAQLWRRVSDYQWHKILHRISLAQSSSERLFRILYQRYQCGCHKLKLWLDFDLVATLSPGMDTHSPLSYYRFFVTLTTQQYIDATGSIMMQVDSIQASHQFETYRTLEIASGPIMPLRQLKSRSMPRSTTRSHFQFNDQQITPDESLAQLTAEVPPLPVLQVPQSHPPGKSAVKKAVRFACDIKKTLQLKRQHSSVQQQQPTCPPALRILEHHMDTIGSTETLVEEEESSSETGELSSVDSLCALLSGLGSFRKPERSSLGCLRDPGGYRHQIFDGCDQTIEKEPSAALRDLLPQIDQFLLDDRLRAAYHLASSLLQLHLPTWVTEGWSSSELMLMHKDSQAGKEDWLLYSECFQMKSNEIGEADLDRQDSSHIRRLGIILLEIGQAEPLPEGYNSGQQIKYAPTRVKKVMGAPYLPVVDICLNWTDRTGMSEDLLDESVQRRFYDEVVQKLKTWVEFFGS